MPEISVEWYRDISALAQAAPAWVRTLAEIGTDAVIVLFGLLCLACWWRARRADAGAMATALLVPAGTVAAYALSESVKLVIREQRPCRAVPDVPAGLVPCPSPGDWSFPSNHSTIAAAVAVGLAVASRRMAFVSLPLALLAGFSRVFVGVHYPHDVLAGFVVGTTVSAMVLCCAGSAGTRAVRHLRSGSRWQRLVVASQVVASQRDIPPVSESQPEPHRVTASRDTPGNAPTAPISPVTEPIASVTQPVIPVARGLAPGTDRPDGNRPRPARGYAHRSGQGPPGPGPH